MSIKQAEMRCDDDFHSSGNARLLADLLLTWTGSGKYCSRFARAYGCIQNLALCANVLKNAPIMSRATFHIDYAYAVRRSRARKASPTTRCMELPLVYAEGHRNLDHREQSRRKRHISLAHTRLHTRSCGQLRNPVPRNIRASPSPCTHTKVKEYPASATCPPHQGTRHPMLAGPR